MRLVEELAVHREIKEIRENICLPELPDLL
jgi:hypothetical protein